MAKFSENLVTKHFFALENSFSILAKRESIGREIPVVPNHNAFQ